MDITLIIERTLKVSLDLKDISIREIIAPLIVVIITAITGFIIKHRRKIFFNLRKKSKEKKALKRYRDTLEKRTFHIRHDWMKKDQTLDDILVPISFNLNEKIKKDELEAFIKRAYTEDISSRILILGRPGGGKTVAMRFITRMMWELGDDEDINIGLIPILLNFSDIKEVKTDKALETKIIDNLKYYQFDLGKHDRIGIENFVKENLYNGKLLLLFDGYDELEKSARKSISKFLNYFLGANTQVPAIISSRISVYDKELAFDHLKPNKIYIAPFTPYIILKFLSQWKFEENKSAHELFELINGKAHLSELASNPLMLTIISYLYSLPKFNLPDNRVQFYDQCTRALLEEWDISQQRDRVNKFKTHQKIAVLSRIAFDHIKIAEETDEFIHESKIHINTKEEMRKLSLKAGEYTFMIDEIVNNSGLLQKIPPYEYRFPHRTFMEFFAANYIATEKDYKIVIKLYEQDPEKWKEVLLLYMGINKNKEYSNLILEYLKNDFKKNSNNLEINNFFVFNALTECAVPNPQIASEILDLAELFLLERKPIAEIIEQVGFISANPRWDYSQKANKILTKLLEQNLDDNIFQQVLLSLVHAVDKTADKIVLNNLKRLKLKEFLANLGSKGKYFIHRILSIDLSISDIENIIEGIRDAGNFEILFSLLLENNNPNIKGLAAYALSRMSKLPDFFEFLSYANVKQLDYNTEVLINKKFIEWGWNWDFPDNETGKKMCVLICYFTAQFISSNIDSYPAH